MKSRIQACLQRSALCAVALLFNAETTYANDWPTARLNGQRNAFCAAEVDPARLVLAWTYRSPNPPSPAWHGPAKWDAYSDVRMHSMRNYDEVFQPIAAGECVYFGSSVDDTVTCLDTVTGEEHWTFFADGPVRVAPTFSDGKIYFGSDDGHAYCLRADDGQLVWKYQPKPSGRQIVNNGRFIPLLPIRSGVIVSDGIAYFAASLLPWNASYLCAVDAETGSTEGENLYVREVKDTTFEGPLAVSPRLVIAPQGRVPPLLFSRRTGKQLGALDGGGGSFVVVMPNEQVVHGPGNKTGWVTVSNADSREKLATHNNASALVLDNEHTYLLTKTSIGSVNTKTGKENWRAPCDDGIELIGVGDALLVGKTNRVDAYAKDDGTLLWSAPVEGKAFGLCFAQDRLLVSTDLGFLHAFEPTATEPTKPITMASQAAREQIDRSKLASIEQDVGPGLLGRWVFQPPAMQRFHVDNLAGGLPASIDGNADLVNVGDFAALPIVDGNTTVTITEKIDEAKLPERSMTVAAWVRIDKPRIWGGIIGALQDNGADEHGWVLGYRESKFCIGVAGENGNGRITYLNAADDFTMRAWHHVAGVYDGQTLSLYVDGVLSATSKAQSGPIRYPDDAPYVIGAYRDKNENHSLQGMIHEVRVYDRALSADALRTQFNEKSQRLPSPEPAPEEPETYNVAVGPWLQFDKLGEAVIRWQTAQPTTTRLEYRLNDEVKQIKKPEKSTAHEVRLPSLLRKRLYHYVIQFDRDGQTLRTPEYECDTFFDYNVNQDHLELTDDGKYRDAAAAILRRADVDKGLCLDWDATSGRLAEALVRQSELRVLCVCREEETAQTMRLRLRKLGLYGSRITVRFAAEYDELGLTKHWANLVVSEAMLDSGRRPDTQQVRQALAPTGVAILGESPEQPELMRGTPFAGAGDWSYIYGRADNSAYGGEALGGAKSSEDIEVQWLGRPGPRYQADRSGRKTPPLSFGGRLFLEGLHRIVALDIYNGAVLWALETPNFERFNIPRDCANWCGAGESLLAAVRDRCWRIEAATGAVSQMYQLPAEQVKSGEFDWGFIAASQDVVLGSAVKRGTSYTDFWGGAGWYDAEEGPETYKVCSESLFARDKQSGDLRWNYSEGLIINSTITISDNRLFFVEGRHPELRTAEARRLNSPELWEKQYLVALDIATGKKQWEQPLDTVDGTVVFFMAHSADKLVIVSSTAGEFHVYALYDGSGEQLWDATFPWGREGKADHGSHMSRPAIVGDRLFVRPAVLDIATGKIRDERVPEGKCGTYSCTTHALFFRGDPGHRFAMWSAEGNQYSLWDRLRPDCWLSSIPAGGMMLSPEGGGGCSCGSWMETSIGFIPRAHLQPSR